MNYVDLYRYNSTNDAFEYQAKKQIISGNYSKAINEMGEFSFEIQTLKDSTDPLMYDKVILYSNGNKINSGYVLDLQYSKNTINVICFTEEYKLTNTFFPDYYTQNFIGLRLKELATILSRQYTSLRIQDKNDFDTYLKSYHGFYNDNYTNKVVSFTTDNTFCYELVESYQEFGEYLNELGTGDELIYYDTILIIDIHNSYFDSTVVNTNGKNKTDDLRKFLHCDLIEISTDARILINFSYYNGTSNALGGIRKKQGSIDQNTTDDLIAGFDVLNNRNTKIKLYVNSTHTDYSNLIQGLVSSDNFDDTDTAVNYEGCKVTSNGSDFQTLSTYDYKKFFVDLKNDFPDYKVERIRWSEPEKFQSDDSIYTKRNFTELYLDFKNTNGYDSGSLVSKGDTVLFSMINKYPNEYTEKTGVVMPIENTSNDNLYFSFYNLPDVSFKGFTGDAYDIPTDRSSLSVARPELLRGDNLRAIEIIMYKDHLTVSPTVDTNIEELLPLNFDVDNKSHYEVLKSICDELQTRFKVENDKLYIEEAETSTTTFEFIEDINCIVETVKETDENKANFLIFKGVGDSPINSPYINYAYTNGLTQFRQVDKVRETKDRTNTTLNSNITSYKTGYDTTTKEITILVDIRELTTLPEIGDKITLRLNRINKSYTDLEIKDISYTLTSEEGQINITAGNITKKLR